MVISIDIGPVLVLVGYILSVLPQLQKDILILLAPK